MPFTYKKEDFDTSEPYKNLMDIDDPFERQIQEDELKEYAVKLGVPSFGKRLKTYEDSLNPRKNAKLHEVRMTNFTGQPIDLDCGDWTANDFGITKDTQEGTAFACPNPVTITRRIVNIDTGEEKLELAYTKGDKKWRRRIFSKGVTSNSRKIVELAECGIAVTSETAKYLVNYLFQLENLNLDIIPETKSISRLGMIKDVGFSPYVKGIVFDGDDNKLKNAYSAVKSKGDRDEWIKLMQGLRGTNVELRILLATSFASVLVSPLNINPFFVHIWSGESGSGKTVALMCAASIWGDPHWQGQAYIQNFNATQVGLERSAAFFNHLPLMIDELQLLKNSHGQNKFDIVYLLSEGQGRTRGNTAGGIDQTPTWANCIITTGETPITTDSSGAGAINRVISIECSPENPIITDGNTLVGLLYKNYGFAGKEFVDRLYEPGDLNITLAQDIYNNFFKELSEGESTEKQAMAAAAILTGDALATEWIFHDGQALTAKDISKFLATKDEVNVGERGYHYICDWVAQNANKLRAQTSDDRGDIYGIIEDNVAYIIASVFDKACRDGGFDPRPLRSWMKKKGKLALQGDKSINTVKKRIGGLAAIRCVAVILDSDDEVTANDDIPF